MVSNALPTEFGETLELRRFTSEEYMAMVEAGILTSEDHVELIDGIIVAMSPAGSKHNHVVMLLNRLFAPRFDDVLASVQGTLQLREEQIFDPDFMLLKMKPGGYRNALPTSDEVLLLIEVADTSLARDRAIKLPIYAGAGVPEYWIVDLTREVVIVHRDPDGDAYTTVTEHRKGDSIAALTLPDHVIAVDPLVA